MASLGLLQLISSAAVWSWPQPKLFLLYVCMAIVCSSVQVKMIAGAGSPPLSANVPVILLSILQLNLPEAVIVGASAALAQGLLNKQTRSKPLQLMLGTCVVASVIATADFVYLALLPNFVRNSTVRLLAAALALFFANTFPVALANREQQQKRLGQVWKESYSWLVPYYLVSAAIASAANAAATGGVSLQTMLLVLPAVYLAYRYYRVQKSNLEMRESTAESMAALHLRAIEGLALAVEAKDSLNTRGHLRRVRVYALGIAKDLGLKGDEIEALQAGALLHDIGKLAVPEYILTKPGKLTTEEFAKMKVHPIVGAEIVEQVQFPYAVAPIVRAHHEKWDGSGYPFGLKGEDIPIGARILSAVDYLDALASDREYRRALSLDDAMKRVQEEAGRGLDPKVVEVLAKRYRELEQAAKAEIGSATLSRNAKVEHGNAPDAGLDLWALTGVHSNNGDFVNSIAAAGREQQNVHALMQGIGSSFDLDKILQHVENGLRTLMPSSAMAIFISQGDTLVIEHSGGECKDMLSPEVRAGEGLVGWVAQNQQPIVNGNPTVDPGYRGAAENGLQAALAVPLKRVNGLSGVLAYYRRERDSFTADDLRILSEVAPRIGIAIENALKVKEIQERANVDLATGLPSLRGMTEALDLELVRSKRQKQPLAVVIVEFTGVNLLRPESSQFDPDTGLRTAARLLREGCREYDHIARIGDETFGLIMPGMKRETIGPKIAKLQETVSRIFPHSADNEAIRFALGSALYPDDADTSKLLMAVAEGRKAMQVGGSPESLLALHAQNRVEVATQSSDEKVST